MIPSETNDMDDSAAQFYDQLADHYTLIFENWEAAVQRHGQLLDTFIRAQGFAPPATLLDCTCGIGTQAIGLAQRGYSVTGTDISSGAIDHARNYAAQMKVIVSFEVADVRELAEKVTGEFDLVVSFDNGLPHLLTDDDLQKAAHNLYTKVKPGGGLIASIRDYDQAAQEKPHATLPRVYDTTGERRIIFQVWDWAEDDKTYRLQHYIVRGKDNQWETIYGSTTYRALLRHELSSFLAFAGFADIRWHMPDESSYYQPIVTARKR
jgi:SAM-dependent methyltransferase